MKARTVRTILFKELLDMLRDKRTLIAMIGAPVLLYPLIFIFGSQAVIYQTTKLEKAASRVSVLAQEGSPVFGWVDAIEDVDLATTETPLEDLSAGDVDAVVEVDEDVTQALATNHEAKLKVSYDATEPLSQIASRRLVEGLNKREKDLLAERLSREGLEPDFASPIDISSENVAPPAKAAGTFMGMALPIIIVVMLGVGAFYPAIDLTAGEKERGTFETLLSTPATTLEIVTGKFLTVFLLSLLTGILNLGSMVAVVALQLVELGDAMGEMSVEIPPYTAFLIFITLVPLSFFISAVMMSLGVLARSFKEAQNFVAPFFMIIMFPAVLAALPGTELTTGMQFVPVANVALLFRDLITGEGSAELVFATILSTAVYAVIALLLASWLFQREEVVLSQERGIPLTWRRSTVARPTPTTGMSLVVLGLCFLLLFYVGSYAQGRNVVVGMLVTQWLLLFAPVLLILWYTRVDIRNALNLRAPHPATLAATVIAAAGWLVVMMQLSIWHNRFLPMPEEMASELERILSAENLGLGMPAMVLVFAVSPAICEELLFRGALLSGLRGRMPAWAVCAVVGVLFGLFHLTVYKVLITSLTGVFLTYLVLRSGSIVHGMLAHVLINALGILANNGVMPARLLEYVESDAFEQHGFPAWVLIAAVAVLAAGIVLFRLTTRRTAATTRSRGSGRASAGGG